MKSSKTVRFIIAGISLLAIIAYGYTMLTASERTEEVYEDLTGKDSLDYYIFTELLERLDYSIAEWRDPEKLPKNGVFILLKPTSEYKVRMKSELLDWVRDGNILVISGMSEALELLTGFEMESIAAGKDNDIWNIQNLEQYPRSTLKYVTNTVFPETEEVIPYASNAFGVLAGGREEGDGEILLFSDIRILTNMELENYDTAELINAVFARYHDRKIYYAGVRGTQVTESEGNPILILFKGRLKFVTIQVLMLLLFYYFAVGIRFGPPDLPTVEEQRFLKRHLKGLGGFFEKMKAGFFILEIYQKYYRTELLEFYSLPKNISNSILINHMEKSAPGKTDEAMKFFSAEKLSVSEIMYLRNQMNIIIKEIKSKGRKDGI